MCKPLSQPVAELMARGLQIDQQIYRLRREQERIAAEIVVRVAEAQRDEVATVGSEA